jgi:hypothetical protein
MNSSGVREYDFSYSNMVMMIGGQLLLLIIIIFIVNMGVDVSSIEFPYAQQVRNMVKASKGTNSEI